MAVAPDSSCVEGAQAEKKPPGRGPAVLDSVRVVFAYALASPSAGRCENQKYAK